MYCPHCRQDVEPEMELNDHDHTKSAGESFTYLCPICSLVLDEEEVETLEVN